MNLKELKRIGADRGYPWIAVDLDCDCYGYSHKPSNKFDDSWDASPAHLKVDYTGKKHWAETLRKTK